MTLIEKQILLQRRHVLFAIFLLPSSILHLSLPLSYQTYYFLVEETSSHKLFCFPHSKLHLERDQSLCESLVFLFLHSLLIS